MNKGRTRPSVRINGAALRHVRMLTGLTLTALADEVGVTATYLSMLESGARARCSVSVFNGLNIRLRIADRRVLMADPTLAAPAVLNAASPGATVSAEAVA